MDLFRFPPLLDPFHDHRIKPETFMGSQPHSASTGTPINGVQPFQDELMRLRWRSVGNGKESEFGASNYISRELSWWEFNQRVRDEAFDPKNPLLERLKFFSITSSNLDEFFEVRVSGLKQQIESDIVERAMDGSTASDSFRAIVKRVRRMVDDQYVCWRDNLRPALGKNGIRILSVEELPPEDLLWLEEYYRNQVRPVLTPLAIDPAHPFPQLLNKSLNLIVRLEMKRREEVLKHMAVVQIPRILPRMVKLP